MARSRILVVADDAALRASLARWLMAAGYGVELSESPSRARDVVANHDIALAIVAPNGLGVAGVELARELTKSVGRLILVADQSAETGGPMGAIAADGSISRPLQEQEVLARIKAVLPSRPAREEASGPELLRFDQFTIDLAAHDCRDVNGKQVALTRAEFSLLALLARDRGRVLSRDELRHAVAGRGAEPDDRSVDVLISRLRRKIEQDPKEPRIIITVPGEGYKLIAQPATIASSAEAARAQLSAGDQSFESTKTTKMPWSRRPAVAKLSVAMTLAAGSALAGIAGLVLLWYPGSATRSTPAAVEKFDAAVVPLVDDATRRSLASYPAQPDAKAIAVSGDGWGVAFGASDLESAKREALERCGGRAKLAKICRIYAAGMDVAWQTGALALPLPADLHTEPLDARLVAADIPLLSQESRSKIDVGFVKARDHRALAIKPNGKGTGYWGLAGHATQAEAVRLAVERCGDLTQAPCLLLSVDGFLAVQIPRSRRIVDLFLLATETQMTDQDKRRVGEVYREKEWRALARGKSGSWHPVANAPSEATAIEAALGSCAQADGDCHIHAIGNFRVADTE